MLNGHGGLEDSADMYQVHAVPLPVHFTGSVAQGLQAGVTQVNGNNHVPAESALQSTLGNHGVSRLQIGHWSFGGQEPKWNQKTLTNLDNQHIVHSARLGDAHGQPRV